jgi:uncharacterized protein
MLLIADTSPLISLIVINELNILKKLFPDFSLPLAVWNELESHNQLKSFEKELDFLNKHTRIPISKPITIPGIDVGETEAIQLYVEMDADILLIDDKKARAIAELMDIKCIGTLALLTLAKRKGIVKTLKPLFIKLLKHKRYYSKRLINEVLLINDETELY